MLTETNGASALRSRRVSDGRKKRRADGTPYGTAGSAHRPLSAAGDLLDEDEDEDASTQRQHEKRGFFSRLVSYLPIVGKLVPEEEQAAGSDHEMAEDSSDGIETVDLIEDDDGQEEEDEDDAHHGQEAAETVGGAEPSAVFVARNGQPRDEDVESGAAETVRGPPPALSNKESPSSVEAGVHRPSSAGKKRSAHSPSSDSNPQETSPPAHYLRSSHTKPSARDCSVEKAGMGPAVRPQRKRNEQRAFLPVPSQKSKMLRISGNRRRKSSSPSPSDSAKTLIKQKKTISYSEYERLSRQLRELVEPTPQSALALTKSALEEGLEERGAPSSSAYIPGSLSTHANGLAPTSASNGSVPRLDNGESSAVSLTFRKRIGLHDTRPIVFSGPAMRYAHEERLGRRPRPSRLLTGAKRDATSRSAYSAAVAEKILSTLNKIQNPLEREAEKPTPSTSLSWAKYHLALVDETTARSRDQDDTRSGQQSPPPTSVLPRVPVAPSQTQPTAGSLSSTPSSMRTGLATTPPSPQAASAAAAIATAQPKTVTMGEFTFTLPRKTLGRVDEDEDMTIQFEFSPPPALREPPRNTLSSASALATGTAAPFSFMPPSPKEKAEWAPKSVTPKKPATTKTPEASGKTSATGPVSSGSNPLARFMQVAPGTWKCPTCSVANQDKYSKCPCCDTAKPGASSVSKPAAPTVSATSTDSTNPLARFMQAAPGTWKCPTCAVANQDKFAKCPCCDTAKPGGSAAPTSSTGPVAAPSAKVSAATSSATTSEGITSSGFSFGAPPASNADVPKSETKPSGFSFGVNPASDKPKSDATPSTGGFSFSFSASKKDEAKSSAETKPNGFTFGAPSQEKKDAVDKLSFSFSAPATDAIPTSVDADAAKAPVPAFTFSAPPSAAKTQSAPSTFSFNASTALPTSFGETKSTKRKADESSKASTEAPSSGFSFGIAPSTSAKASENSDRPAKKRIAPVMSAEKQPTAPTFAFGSAASDSTAKPSAPTFGGSLSTPSTSSSLTPATSFGAAKSEENKPAGVSFTFGASPDANKSSSGASATSAAPPSGFVFGAPPKQSAEATSPAKPAAAFGASLTSSLSEPKPAAPFGAASSSGDKAAFTFGQTAASGSAPASSSTAFGSSMTSTTSGFGFSAPPSSAAAASTKPAVVTSAPSLTFGSSAQAPASGASDTSMSPSGFGASSTPSPTFGQSTTTPAFGQSHSAPSPAFGQTPSAPSPAFGQTPSAPSPAFGQTPNAPSPSFGQSSTAPAFGQAATAPSPAFGQAAAQPSTTFGAASGFRSISPAPTQTTTFGKGAASGASTSPSFAFGAAGPAASSAPAPQQTFGFGAAPASSGFGASTGFGAPAPTSSGFGSAPAAAPASGFGAGFGAAAPAAFGVQAPPAAPAFGAPNPSTAFGGAPAFGAAPSGFGAPAPAFGAAPAAAAAPAFGAGAGGFGAPAAGGFGAPAPAASGFGAPASADNGFSVGAAPPQHSKGRRILRARSRRAN